MLVWSTPSPLFGTASASPPISIASALMVGAVTEERELDSEEEAQDSPQLRCHLIAAADWRHTLIGAASRVLNADQFDPLGHFPGPKRGRCLSHHQHKENRRAAF
jgi:hypothetical protein